MTQYQQINMTCIITNVENYRIIRQIKERIKDRSECEREERTKKTEEDISQEKLL